MNPTPDPTLNNSNNGTITSVPTTLSFADINGGSPVTTPPTSNPAATLNSLVASTAQPITDAINTDKNAENNVTNNTNDLSSLISSLGGETADKNAAESAVGLPGLNKDLLDLQNTARQQNIQYQTTPYSLAGQGRGINTGILRGQEAMKQRQIGIDLMVTNSNIAAKQGNITLAQSLADKAVAAKYDPIKQAIAAKQFLLDNNYKDLNRADQKLATAQKTKLDLQTKQIDMQIQNEKDINAIKLEAAKNGAPNSVLNAMNGAKTTDEALNLSKGFLQDTLAKQIKVAQLTKLNQEISAGDLASKVYTPGANPSVDAWVQNINAGTAKLSDLTGNPALKNLVMQGLAVNTGSTSDILSTTQQSLAELQGMVDSNHGFTTAVGTNIPNPFGIFTDLPDQFFFKGVAGSQSADFIAKFNQVKNDIVLPNLKLLRGLGRVTDREFQALTHAMTSLDTKNTEGEFKTELKTITDRINTLLDKSPTTSSTPIMGQTTVINGVTYKSDGKQWVKQ